MNLLHCTSIRILRSSVPTMNACLSDTLKFDLNCCPNQTDVAVFPNFVMGIPFPNGPIHWKKKSPITCNGGALIGWIPSFLH